ncbi:type II secretion system protein [Intestinibacter sp.]|uniref:type II secretion system protein n=1 Tax=Intestinibacter sp. TaxID=1965304 RepID=UPI002A90B3EF|nr:prepilin-type N-terminal cleavage/methylation domain-containing protein [Intestinibacter sp.]MDY5213037.1 prepilin-type N-terminal cleavage/methylation domain-containing protein [Intestinibacter sp.]
MEELIKRSKKKGFTLVELIIVIAIIGLLAAIAIPKYYSKINEAKKSSAISEASEIVIAVKCFNGSNESGVGDIEESDSYGTFKSKINEYVNINSIKYIEDDMTYKKINNIKTGKQKIIIKNDKINFIN